MKPPSGNGAIAAPVSEQRWERRIMAQVEALETDAREQLGDRLSVPEANEVSVALAGSLVSRIAWTSLTALEELSSRQWRKGRALTALTLTALELEQDIRRRVMRERAKRYEDMQSGLSQLRRLGTSAELLDRVCEELVRSCGFSRAMLTRIDGTTWVPWMAYFLDDRDFEHEFVEWMGSQRFPAEAMGAELGRLRPVLVRDSATDPRTFKPMIEAAKTPSYVAAPVSPAGRLVGVLYADYYPSDRVVDELDRDLLAAFADVFGLLYERIVLIERTRSQRTHVREAFEFAETIMATASNAEIELGQTAGEHEAADGGASLESPSAAPLIEELLTPREVEVLGMIVRGAPNAAIAERLVIKEGTVKSHVKHILRKLGAVNRSEAISLYMGAEPR
jgi:DNA-binding CsgD family transcriptional regulator/GAF domain-containing protein